MCLKKKSYLSWIESKEIVHKAQKQAQSIRKKAHLDAIIIKENALKEAREAWKEEQI